MTQISAENCWPSRCRRVSAWLCAALCWYGVALAEDKPVVQPIPFSHKRHHGAALDCLDCHTGAKSQADAGLPSAQKCMFCHVSIRTDSPSVRQIAAAAKSATPIRWVRVYRLPDFVFFSHSSHAKAGVDCANCHGPVAEREVLAAEVSTKMARCVECHRERRASTECALCHQLGN